MELKKITGKQLIYDGSEEKFYQEHILELDNGDTIHFAPTEIIELDELDREEKKELVEKILINLPTIKRFAPTSDYVYYKNQEGVTPHIKETKKYIAIISLGESQPSRYLIYLEAVFLKDNYGISIM